jgi:hypothetical protein
LRFEANLVQKTKTKQNKKHKFLFQKYPIHTHTHTQKKTGGVAQVVECLPIKCEALNSNPSTVKTKQNKTLK